MLRIDMENRIITGSCKARDIKKYGLIKASVGVEEDV